MLQLLTEVAPLDVKVEDPRVVDQHRKRTVGERRGRLAQNLVQDDVVLLWGTEGASNLDGVPTERESGHLGVFEGLLHF